jgi:hypothetical protein
MTAFDYSSLYATSKRLVDRFGLDASLRKVTGGSYDPVTGIVSGGSTADTNVRAVITNITKDYVSEAEIQQGDRIAIVDGAVAPTLSDLLIVGSDIWQIVNVVEINPGATALLYKAQVRK